ncbi:hypothetical protein N7457_006709, partial [Penicillium paradoxum]|uniref:uncharacterized protein n=1 Tax=Penicillium paradoxum TaxID=176176 RepID=UPI002548B197
AKGSHQRVQGRAGYSGVEWWYSGYSCEWAEWTEDEDSLVVTHPTTNSPACGLSTAERTGSPIFHTLWSEDSLVVTHPTTNSPACGLSTAERTGSPVFHTLWSYVIVVARGRNIRCN